MDNDDNSRMEDSEDSWVAPAPVPAKSNPDVARPQQNDEQSVGGASASQRTRWVPPDSKPPRWHVRHRSKLHAAEWGATCFFLVVALYYLWLLLFVPPKPFVPSVRTPTREEFRERLWSLPAAAARPEWRSQAKPGRWRGIVIHHTATTGGSPEAIDRHHRETNKWENGLGYHFVIGNGNGMPDGTVAVGNRWVNQEKLKGAHVRDASAAMKREFFNMPENAKPNDFTIGIALVGDFENQLPTAKQLAALKGLLTFLRQEYTIELKAIVGHGQINNTKCPGKFFFMDEVYLALANP